MPCPITALHLPILFLIFLFPLSLSMSSSATNHQLSTSSSSRNVFGDHHHPSKAIQSQLHQHPQHSKNLNHYSPVLRDYKSNQGDLNYNNPKRVARATYNTYNSSSSTSSEGNGGDGSNPDADVVHKLLGGPPDAGKKAAVDGTGNEMGPPPSSIAVDSDWDVTFLPDHVDKLQEGDELEITLVTQLTKEEAQYYQIRLVAGDDDWVASVYPDVVDLIPLAANESVNSSSVPGDSSWSANFSIKGVFVGFAKVRALLEIRPGMNVDEGHLSLSNVTSKNFLKVSVIRKNSWMDRAFTVSIAVLVSILFVNFGAALDWNILRETLKRPIGPSIGFLTQFLFMPIVGYVLGLLLFESPSMRLGLFFTGCSPGGGASNIWTFALGGNLPLSITMTTISTFASFGMMPFWLFTLGATIFSSAELSVPYSKIATFAIALVVPLALGFLMQKKWPKVAYFLVRHLLKPLCGFLLVFIVVFAIATNLYIFHLFSWKIIFCGMGLPWLGFVCGAVAARLFSLSKADILAIAIETGVQNTGIAIFMLRFTLGQPLADLTTVIPVSIAIMTPVPLAVLWLYRLATGKIHLRMRCGDVEEVGVQRPLRESTVETFNGAMVPIDRKVKLLMRNYTLKLKEMSRQLLLLVDVLEKVVEEVVQEVNIPLAYAEGMQPANVSS